MVPLNMFSDSTLQIVLQSSMYAQQYMGREVTQCSWGEVESCLELPVKSLNHSIGYGEVRYTLGSMNSEQTCKLSPKRNFELVATVIVTVVETPE